MSVKNGFPARATAFCRSLPRQVWQTSLWLNRHQWLGLLAGIAALVHGLLWFSYPHASKIASQFMVLFSIGLFFLAPVPLRRSPVFWLLLAAALVPLASWGLSHLTHPQWADGSPKLDRVANWLMCIAIALALGGRTRNVLLLWFIALAGLMAAPWTTGAGFAEIARGLKGLRIDFDLHNAQHAAMYFGVAAIGLLALLPSLLKRSRRNWLLVGLWFAGFCYVSLMVALTQTRAVWLGLLLAIGVLCWLWLRHYLHGWQRWLPLLVLAAFLAALATSELVQKRANKDLDTIVSAFEGETSDVAFDSPGVRLHSWVEASHWIVQRPLLGWGGKGRNLVIQQAEHFPDWLKQSTHHLHSSYIDTLVNFGAVGLMLLLAIWFWLLRAVWRAHGSQTLAPGMMQFFTAFMAYWLLVNAFESYMYFSSGIFIFGLVAGGVLSCLWRAEYSAAA